jgi:preprotein translocase subunit SecE
MGRRRGRRDDEERKNETMTWFAQLRDFVKEVQVELGKVSWPTRSELRDSTIVVIVTVLIVAVFVGIVDRILNAAIGLLFR